MIAHNRKRKRGSAFITSPPAWFNVKYLMLSKQQFRCNFFFFFVCVFVLPSPWRPGRPTCHPDYLNLVEGWVGDRAGSPQAVGRTTRWFSGLVLVMMGWALDDLEILTGAGVRQCHVWQRSPENNENNTHKTGGR